MVACSSRVRPQGCPGSRCGPALGATHGGQLWTPALTLPHVRDGLSVRRMAVLCTCSMSSIYPHVHRQFMRNELHDFTTIVPVTVYHQGSCVETYSRYK